MPQPQNNAFSVPLQMVHRSKLIPHYYIQVSPKHIPTSADHEEYAAFDVCSLNCHPNKSLHKLNNCEVCLAENDLTYTHTLTMYMYVLKAEQKIYLGARYFHQTGM